MPESLISLEGGLDLRSASINAPKGTLAACYNFEKDQGPGYARRLGFARYDGRICGPEIEDALVIKFLPTNAFGTFQYGEQVVIASAGLPTFTGILIAQVGLGTLGSLTIAYPISDYTDWVDITTYPSGTTVTGQSSGALVTSIQAPPCLMNDDSLGIFQYDSIKRAAIGMHSASVGAVPGRNESPLDAIFTYGNNSYAIHDCVAFTYTGGSSVLTAATKTNISEGNCLRENATGKQMGIILSVSVASGSFEQANAAGTIIVYDFPLGQALPALNAKIDLYNATNTTLLKSSAFTMNVSADPATTRAIMYTTYEQYVKTQPYITYGTKGIKPPKYFAVAPPTWTRCPLTRELPYTTVNVPADPLNNCFGPTGSNFYSTYEYSRLGLTAAISNNQALNTGEKFPTAALDVGGGRWVNPNNILVQDAAVAAYPAISNNTGLVTAALRGTTFDFSAIPDGSLILGVQFRFRANSTLTGSYYASNIFLTSGAFPNGVSTHNKAGPGQLLANALTDYTYGGPTDCWGEALNTTIIKDTSFGVQLAFTKSNAAATQQVFVDAYAMTVYYAPTTRTVYIRNQDPSVATNQDVPANIIHYSIDSGDFQSRSAVGVLTVTFGTTEAAGTSAGKTRRLGPGNEIRTAPSSVINAPGGVLLGFVAEEDYPTSFPPGYALDANLSRYEAITSNFWDVPEGDAAYIVNGVEYASMYDGTFQVRMRTGRGNNDDCPRHVASHLRYLHLGFGNGSVVWSATGKPLTFTGGSAAQGAGGINFAEPITGMLTLNGQTLGVWTDRSTRGLQGTDPTGQDLSAGYVPTVISPAINCIEYSLVNLVGEAVWMSYRGVETIRSVNAYGDFETLPLSAPAQLWLQGRLQVDLRIGSIPSRLVYSIGVRNKRQYRAYFADGYCFTLTLFDAGDLPVCTVQRLARPNATTAPSGLNDEPMNAGVIRHIYNGTRTDGKELILACFENQNPAIIPAAGGSNIGPYFPYGIRIDCGYADDIQPAMPSWIELNGIYATYPTKEAQFQSLTLFLNAYGGTQINTYSKFDFDGPIIDTNYKGSQTVPSVGTQITNTTMPVIETRAFIPVPGRWQKIDVSGQGRCLKLRFDLTQTNALTNPVLVPMRLTHVSVTTNERSLDRT